MVQFEVGKTYRMRSLCDYNAIWEYTIVSRTAKMVTLNNGKKFRVSVYDNAERISPLGTYSMCPILKAA